MLVISKRNFMTVAFGAIVVMLYAFFLFFTSSSFEEDFTIKFSILSSLIIFILEIVYINKLNGGVINPITLFLIAFYVFQNGQLLLVALDIPFYDFYISTLKIFLKDVSIFSSLSNVVAGYAGIICVSILQKEKHYVIDQYNPLEVGRVAWLGFLGTSILALPLVAMKFLTSLEGGYYAVRAFEENIPTLVTFLEFMFMPFSLLTIIFRSDKSSQVARYGVFIWLVLTALCGDRTTGISGLLILALVSYNKNSGNIKYNWKDISKISFIGLLLIIFIRVVYAYRTGEDILFALSGGNFLVGFLSELGISVFPLFTMMYIVPGQEAFLWGQGYILSAIGGSIPSFLDITGVVNVINQQSRIFETWHSQYFGQYSFGLGFSLNAEAYINFGWFGLIAIFIVCLIIFSFLRVKNLKEHTSPWELYRISILLFLWFTLPRRDSYYIWKAISYSLIFIRIYIQTTCRRTAFLGKTGSKVELRK